MDRRSGHPAGRTPRLPPLELGARLDRILACTGRLLDALPQGALDHKPPQRDRSVRDLAFHVFRLSLAYVDGALTGTTVGEQTEQVFVNLQAILAAAGSRLDWVVKTTVFLASMEDFAEMNEVYKRHVGEQPPARSTVQVAKLPADALIEIEAVAHT